MTGYLRSVLRHRLATELSLGLVAVGGIAVGTGSVVTVQILTAGAISAFDRTVDLVSGDADAVVLGHGGKLDEELYPVVLATEGVAAATPVLETTLLVRAPAPNPDAKAPDLHAPAPFRRVQLYGLDLLSSPEIPRYLAGSDAQAAGRQSGSFGAIPDSPPHITSLGDAAISGGLARELGLQAGDSMEIGYGPARTSLIVSRVLTDQAGPGGGPALVMDMHAAQEALGGAEWITRINVRFRSGYAPQEVLARLADNLDGGALLSSPEEQRREAERLLASFRTNLSALSFISVFVGLFLVYGTTRASLIRRREEMGVLRSLGATRSQVLVVVLAEAGVLGLLGAALGVPLGFLAAQANLESVSGTVTDLYLLSAIQNLEVPGSVWILAVVGGLVGTLVGAAGPAAEVCLTPVTALLTEQRVRGRWRAWAKWLWRGGWLLLAVLLAWFAAGGRRWQHAGFVVAGGIMVWTALVTPKFVSALCGRVNPRGFGWRFALRSLSVRVHTSGVAVAGVAIAVGTLVGITVMVGSFRDTFTTWLNRTVRADVYLSAAAWRGEADSGGIGGNLASELRKLSGVAFVDRLRGFGGYAAGLPVALRGVDFGLSALNGRYSFLDGDPGAIAGKVRAGSVVVSEPLARRTGLWEGDFVPVLTKTGPVNAEIAGVYYEYGSERGSLAMDLATMDRWFGPGDPHALAVYLAPGIDAEAGATVVRQAASSYPVTIRTNRSLRENAVRVFDQTFAVTLLLQGMALAMAAAGVALSLLVMAREESRETAVYRALGATRRQVFRFFLGRGIGLASLGGLLGLVGGAGLALTLVYVTNRAYFGWTVQFGIPTFNLLQQGATLALTAVAASWLPALRASSDGAAEARYRAPASGRLRAATGQDPEGGELR